MTIKTKLTALAATAALWLIPASSEAGFTYTNGDPLLGFTQTGNTTSDLLIDLGPSSNFLNRSTPLVLTISGLDAQLESSFGTDFLDPTSEVYFGIIGTTGAATKTLFISAPSGDPAPQTAFNQSGPSTNIVGVKDYYKGRSSTAVNTGAGDPTADFSFTTQLAGLFESNDLGVIAGPISGQLEPYRLVQSTTSDGEKLGTFVYNGNDQFTFTPAVPEPSTVTLALVACASLGFRRFRKPALV